MGFHHPRSNPGRHGGREDRAAAFVVLDNAHEGLPLLAFAVRRPRWQGRRIGGWLIEEAVRRLDALGRRELHLSVLTENPALRLYRKLGFEPVAQAEDGVQEAGIEAGQVWYAVRCVFKWPGNHRKGRRYEERITCWQAQSFDDAVQQAEFEAGEYATSGGGRPMKYLGIAQCYHLFGEPGHGAEVFSLVRDSQLPPERYLNRYFDTGTERQRNF